LPFTTIAARFPTNSDLLGYEEAAISKNPRSKIELSPLAKIDHQMQKEVKLLRKEKKVKRQMKRD
jgi:hypothetical protein